MTSTGPGSTTATGTSPMHATFQPKKPIMGGLVQIKSDTHVAWTGGIPNSGWTDLKISTTDPQQSSQIHPMLDDSSFHEWSKGLGVKFQKKKEACLVFNVNYSSTSKILAWTLLCTSRILEIPPRW